MKHRTPHLALRGLCQQGYIMMALSLALALVLIALSAGLPKIATELRRQREDELIHRGAQYTRAIRQYYRRVGGYPLNLDQLEDTNHMRFLRKRYNDPMTNAEFRMLHVGEVQLAPKVLPTTTPGSSVMNTLSLQGMPAPTDLGQVASSSQPQSETAGPTFGGAPIMGVASTSEKESFRVYNFDNHYKGWLFVYSPLLDKGGLFSRPYDGIPTFTNANAPAPPPPSQMPGTPATAPGIPVPPSLHGTVH